MRAFIRSLGGPRRLPRSGLLALATTVLAGLLWAHGPIGQWTDYHVFADRRAWLGVPNAADVLSNLPFLAIGAWALWKLRRAPAASPSLTAWRAFALAIVITAVGSATYHWAPRTTAWSATGCRSPGPAPPWRRLSSGSASPRTGAGRMCCSRRWASPRCGRLLVADRTGRPRRPAPLPVRPGAADAAGAARPAARPQGDDAGGHASSGLVGRARLLRPGQAVRDRRPAGVRRPRRPERPHPEAPRCRGRCRLAAARGGRGADLGCQLR